MLLHAPSFLLMLSSLLACKGAADPPLPSPPAEQQEPIIRTVLPLIEEISGIADSKAFPGYLWAHEDSGKPPQLHLISREGKVEARVVIKDAYNRDWEEMALSAGHIFIADIGDNRQVFERYWFYKFPEPAVGVDTVSVYKTIMFEYPDGSHDAEAFLVDPDKGHIYIITKRDDPSRLYKLAYPYSDTSVNTLTFIGTLPFTGVVGAALSANGSEVIIKTYPELLHFSRKSGQSLENCLLENPHKTLPYKMEPQGEAVAFANDDTGYFTLSEKGYATMVNLYFYPRVK